MQMMIKNPKMAKMVFEAIKSPAGSTKRLQAKNVLDSFYTIHSNRRNKEVLANPQYMGQGGPIENQGGPAMGYMEPMPAAIAPAPMAPSPTYYPRPINRPFLYQNITPPVAVTPTYQGQGGPADGRGGGITNNTSYAPNFWNSPLGSFLGDIGNGVKGLFSQGAQGAKDLARGTFNVGQGAVKGSTATLDALGTGLVGGVSGTIGLGQMISDPYGKGFSQQSFGKVFNSLYPPGIPSAQATGTSPLSYGDLATKLVNGNTTIFNTKTGQNYSSPDQLAKDLGTNTSGIQWGNIKPASTAPNLTPPETTPAVQTQMTPEMINNIVTGRSWLNAGLQANQQQTTPQLPQQQQQTTPQGYGPSNPLDMGSSQSTGNALHDLILSQVKEGVPVGQAGMAVMVDGEAMSQLLYQKPLSQLTPAELDALPVGASMTGQLTRLKANLSTKKNLDQLNDQLMSAQNDSSQVTEMAQSYIRGKDTYLASLNDMIQKATDDYLSSAQAADPYYQKSMQNYVGYLTTLKGRQTSRYIEFTNQAITAQNNRVTQLQNAYNSAATWINNEVEKATPIMQEQFVMTQQTISDMYNNIAQRMGIVTAVTKESQEVAKSAFDTLKSVLEIAKNFPANERNQLIANAEKQYPQISKLLTGVNVTNLTSSGKNNTLNAADSTFLTTNVFPNVDSPIGAMSSSLVDNTLDKGTILQLYLNDRAKTLKEGNFKKTLGKEIGTDSNGITDLLAANPADFGFTPETWMQSVQAYLTQLKNAYSSGFDALVSGDSANIRTVLKNMAGFKNDNYADWYKKNTDRIAKEWGGLGDDLLSRLFKIAKDKTSYSDSITDSKIAEMLTGLATKFINAN